MDDERDAGMRGRCAFDTGFKELEIVAYIGEFKIVGIAHFGVGQRAELAARLGLHPRVQRQPAHAVQGAHLRKGTQELLETAPFIILNMDKVDFIYAREDAGRGPRRRDARGCMPRSPCTRSTSSSPRRASSSASRAAPWRSRRSIARREAFVEYRAPARASGRSSA